MKRMSITVSERLVRTVADLGAETQLRRAIEAWHVQRGEEIDLSTEAARLRVLLDIADVTVRGWVMDEGYEHLASWHNERDAAERATWQRRRTRSTAQWMAQEAANT